ncbi:MAG: hypothetical protein ACOYNC_12400 [Bacteroidales bacterium]
MKNIILFVALCLATAISRGQGVSINSNGANADASAMLDVQATNKGMLVPRMNTAGRTAIAAPAEGLIVFDTDTRTFWYYSQASWKQIPNTQSGSVPSGPASGDLYGSYPSPSVGKLQNLDVAAGLPSNKQVLKWQASGNKWQGANDSLFLPYNVSAPSSSRLFGITNTTTVSGSSAIFGRSGLTASGVSVYGNAGVWGDNSNSMGVLGSSSSGVGLFGIVNNSGTGVYGINGGAAGNAGTFEITNNSNPDPALLITQQGLGKGIFISFLNPSSADDGLYASVQGTGNGIVSLVQSGRAGWFSNYSATTLNEVLNASNFGLASAGRFQTDNTLNSSSVITAITNGTGRGVEAFINNSNSVSAAVFASSAGSLGIKSESSGLSAVGISSIASPAGGTFGTAVRGVTNGYGDGLRGTGGGAGNGVSGFADNNSSGNGVYGEVSGGTGYAVKGVSNIAGRAAILGSNSAGDGVVGITTGSGYGVKGTAGTTGAGVYGTTNPATASGRAAFFEVTSLTNTYDAVKVVNAGLAGTLALNNTNVNNSVTMVRVTKSGYGDYIVFEDGAGVNQIRFSDAGKGYFNGGTQTGGADMAEVFDVTGEVESYEPGDVLIISVDRDRTVEKSHSAYSGLVAGVYATKPGVLMTEESIDADLSGKVPMGMVGVIPTRVCLEGGEIKRGDFMVTSSLPGVAMKADANRVKPGQIIGKALENYSSPAVGKIRLLVNVK